jgi:hypothetical protein
MYRNLSYYEACSNEKPIWGMNLVTGQRQLKSVTASAKAGILFTHQLMDPLHKKSLHIFSEPKSVAL